MNENDTGRGAVHVASAGHAAFAATMIGFGIQGLVKRDFAAIWQPVPKDLPARSILIYLCALVPLVCGTGIFWRRAAPVAARALLAFLVLWLLLLRLPLMVISFTVNTWYSTCQTAVIVAAAWVLYVWLAGARDARRVGFIAGDSGLRIARALYGLALIPFGLAHFLYLQATAPLVPAWLHAPVAWSYFTGGTFVMAGIAVLAGVCARLAATLSALQIGLFTLLVWVPNVVSGADASQWAEFVVSWALTAGGWVVAESYRGVPWFAVGQRSHRPGIA